MSPVTVRTASTLPATVNLHLVAHCNMTCTYCYAPFEEERKTPRLATDTLVAILRQLADAGVRRVTFAGGEPTLHPDLAHLLRVASSEGLVTSVVSNGSRIDPAWLDTHGPYLRWLTLSIDSVVPSLTRHLGRRTSVATHAHLERVLAICTQVHQWNARRPPDRRLRLKLNVTVTRVNVGEDASAFIRAARPEKVKLFQMLLVARENDQAADLACAPVDFAAYVARLADLAADGIEVVPEDSEAMDGSYAMIDPLGRFYQRVDGRYQHSAPISAAGVMEAWAQVGGFDADRFVQRGGDYEPGLVAAGNRPYLIALEGLDGVGKSTVVAALGQGLAAQIVHNPPAAFVAARAAADAAPPLARRGWYLAANAAAAEEAEQHRAAGRPVVMDRSVASTLAFAAADAGADAPSPWPADLPRPDLLCVLTVDEPTRQARLAARGAQPTAEEDRLARDPAYRARIARGYLALGAVPVDATGPVDVIVQSITRLLTGDAPPTP